MQRNFLWIALGVLLLAVVLFYGWRWYFSPRQESPAELARQALTAGDPAAQELAAARLAGLAGKLGGNEDRNPARQYLTDVLQQSKTPGVRAACIRGLAAIWDYDSVPALLQALDDPSPDVRAAAGESVQKMICIRSQDNPFNANAPAEQRTAAADYLKKMWQDFNKPNKSGKSRLEDWKERLKEKDQRK